MAKKKSQLFTMPAKIIGINSTTNSKTRTLFKGENILLSVMFDEVVNVNPALWVKPSLDFLIGDRRVSASYLSGSSTKNLVFSYTVDSGIGTLSTISIPSNPISANGIASNGGLPNLSSIKDSLGNSANLDYTGGALAGIYIRSSIPTLVNYSLAEDSGSSNSDRITKNPTIKTSGI